MFSGDLKLKVEEESYVLIQYHLEGDNVGWRINLISKMMHQLITQWVDWKISMWNWLQRSEIAKKEKWTNVQSVGPKNVE